MNDKISCIRCGGSGVVPQSGETCVDCHGSRLKPISELISYIESLEIKISEHEDYTSGESGRLDSSNAETERDAANEYATEAKEKNKSLRTHITELEGKLAESDKVRARWKRSSEVWRVGFEIKVKETTQEALALAVALEKKDEALKVLKTRISYIGMPQETRQMVEGRLVPNWGKAIETLEEAIAIKPSPRLLENFKREIEAKTIERVSDYLHESESVPAIVEKLRELADDQQMKLMESKAEAAKPPQEDNEDGK